MSKDHEILTEAIIKQNPLKDYLGETPVLYRRHKKSKKLMAVFPVHRDDSGNYSTYHNNATEYLSPKEIEKVSDPVEHDERGVSTFHNHQQQMLNTVHDLYPVPPEEHKEFLNPGRKLAKMMNDNVKRINKALSRR